ncbi:alternative ribosome rescue aminoacyl-tRNA hydrolase ArfB [Fundidesulfovibrio butyratiphilus]
MMDEQNTIGFADGVFIEPGLRIPEDELTFTAARGGGPGGQHVNKVSTRVTLSFDVAGSPSLTDEQRRRIMERLASRVNQDGVLRVTSGEFRSQAMNKAQTRLRFAELLRGALVREKPRRKTKPTLGSKLRRLESKKRRSQVKSWRAGRDE